MSPRRGGRRLRRHAGGLLFLLLLACSAFANAAGPTPRIATVDWAQAETLVALGVPPVGLAQTADFRDWVGGPLPAATRDIGLRVQPNMELLAQMNLDYFTLSPMYASLAPRVKRVADVRSIEIYYRKTGDVWSKLAAGTRALGALVDRKNAAERLIDDTNAHIAQLARRIPDDTPPLLVVQFMDARHVRVFGAGSLFGAVLDRLGLHTAWTDETSFWGFALVPLERLAAIDDARIVVVDPMPVGVAADLADSAIWQHLPAVRGHEVVRLPPVWSFGGLPSAERFAEVLTTALTGPVRDSSDLSDRQAPR